MISLQVMLDWLGLTSDNGGEQDAFLQSLIDGATAAVAKELGRHLGAPAETVEIHRLAGNRLAVLHDVPVEDEDAEVLVESRQRPGDDWEEVDATSYALEGRALRLQSRGLGWVRVTYTRGFAVDEGPRELRDVVRDLVAEAWNLDTSATDLQSEKLGDYSYTAAQVAGTSGWEQVVRGWSLIIP